MIAMKVSLKAKSTYSFSVLFLSFHGSSATTSLGFFFLCGQEDHNFDFHIVFDEPHS